ncbi:MAG: type I DNA topoisomerase [Firmicutes bacterium]|nr:type I DNA topoisomerase [Bacillota bacterium]
MPRNLVIVESPAKAKTIGKFLGRSYQVKASMGHVIDLPRSQFGIDVEDNFRPKYITIRGKGKIIKDLKDAVKKVERVFLATDPDREGEAISWHLTQALSLDPSAPCRIEFNEITKKAVVESIKHPRPIDYDRVNAQQARRILDRLVGYKLSPLLWSKVKRGLSAGRVQSVAVRLICDREKEIEDFKQEEYWTITGIFSAGGEEVEARGGAGQQTGAEEETVIQAKLVQIEGEKAVIPDETTARKLEEEIKAEKSYMVSAVTKRKRLRHPAPPFITSTLQQEASRKLGFSAKKTMALAQQLYEGLEIGKEGSVGLITYMRTDSLRVSTEAQKEAGEVILSLFGREFMPAKPPVYKTKVAGAQEAHEAIRPTSAARRPELVKPYLTRDQFRLYELIWNRFLASQMRPAVLEVLTIEITGGRFLFRASGSRVEFPGFLILYQEGIDEEKNEEEPALPEVEKEAVLPLLEVKGEQHFTQPPPRYTEAMLVRALEEKGIGRPSTYAPIIDTILRRHYVLLEKKRFVPTELGRVVVDLLKEHFPEIIDPDFTAGMEEKLDLIAAGRADWVEVIHDFYQPFAKDLAKAEEEIERVKLADEVSEVKCEQCGRRMVYKTGRYGRFLACPGYPECRNVKSILVEVGVPCPQCGNKVVERRTKKGRKFFGCSNYPKCNFISWYRPVEKSCPQCGAFCVLKTSKSRGEEIVCSEGCGFKEPVKKGAER